MIVSCPHCSAQFQLTDARLQGAWLTCPSCETFFKVPETSSGQAVAAEPAAPATQAPLAAQPPSQPAMDSLPPLDSAGDDAFVSRPRSSRMRTLPPPPKSPLVGATIAVWGLVVVGIVVISVMLSSARDDRQPEVVGAGASGDSSSRVPHIEDQQQREEDQAGPSTPASFVPQPQSETPAPDPGVADPAPSGFTNPRPDQGSPPMATGPYTGDPAAGMQPSEVPSPSMGAAAYSGDLTAGTQPSEAPTPATGAAPYNGDPTAGMQPSEVTPPSTAEAPYNGDPSAPYTGAPTMAAPTVPVRSVPPPGVKDGHDTPEEAHRAYAKAYSAEDYRACYWGIPPSMRPHAVAGGLQTYRIWLQAGVNALDPTIGATLVAHGISIDEVLSLRTQKQFLAAAARIRDPAGFWAAKHLDSSPATVDLQVQDLAIKGSRATGKVRMVVTVESDDGPVVRRSKKESLLPMSYYRENDLWYVFMGGDFIGRSLVTWPHDDWKPKSR